MIGSRLALAGALLAALTLAACGDSTDQAEPVAPPATPVATVTPAPETAPAIPIAEPTPAATAPAEPVPVPDPTPAGPAAVAPLPAPPPAAAPTPAPPAAEPNPAPTPVVTEPAAVAVLPPEVAALVGPPAEPAPAAVAPGATLEERLAGANPAEGAVYLMQCEICHSMDEGGPARVGPNLFGIVGARVGRDLAFTYSPAFAALHADGAIWTPERLDAFLAAPGAEIPGTRMGFGGFADPDTRADVIAWLATLVPVVGVEPVAPRIFGVQMPGLDPVGFVAVQADVGADLYVSLGCGSCHGADMRGGVASALVGTEFEERWYVRPLIDFLAALRTMPPNEPGTLADGRYLELAAAILAANGFEAGATPLRNNVDTLQTTGFFQPSPQLPRNR